MKTNQRSPGKEVRFLGRVGQEEQRLGQMSGCIPAWSGVPGSVRKVERSGSSDHRLYCCLFNLRVAGPCSPSKVRLGTLWPTFPQVTPSLIPHLCSQHPQLPSKGVGIEPCAILDPLAGRGSAVPLLSSGRMKSRSHPPSIPNKQCPHRVLSS